MNIGIIKNKALKIAERKKKNSSKEAVLFFYEEIKKSYIKKTILDKRIIISNRWKKELIDYKREISDIKKRLSMLGFDVKKIFKVKKNE